MTSKLEKKIKEAQEAYYNGDPIMSDDEYDMLIEQLPKDHPLRRAVGAPPPVASKLSKVPHRIPMGSQNKVVTEDEFRTWTRRTHTEKFVASEKIDGASVEFIYSKGKLVQAISRGDGYVGEDVTHVAIKIPRISQAKYQWTGVLRGEVVIHKEDFIRHLKDQGYANARNSAAGLLRRKEPKHAELLRVYFFDAYEDDTPYSTEMLKMAIIQDLGFDPAPYIYKGPEDVIKWHTNYHKFTRMHLPYDIDGIVVKVNSVARQEEMGDIDGRPKGQIAWKFESAVQESVLEGVRWDVGLGGRITPVAQVRPVIVSGVTISSATLHNYSNIRKLGAWIGCRVLVSRRGETIPYIEKVLNPKKATVPYPAECPSCGAGTQFEGEFLICPDSRCSAKIRGDITKWINVVGIDLVGDHFVEAATSQGLLSDPADLYTINPSVATSLERVGIRLAKKVVTNIQEHKTLDLAQFLAALNIPNVSVATFEALDSAGYATLDKVQNITLEQLVKIPGIGETTAKQILKGLADKKKLIAKLLSVGVRIKGRVQGRLTGSSFCFTGQISIPRDQAQKIVRDLGGDVKTSVSKGLTYLVQANANSATTKSKKAKEYGTKILGESEFFELVEFSPLKYLLK